MVRKRRRKLPLKDAIRIAKKYNRGELMDQMELLLIFGWGSFMTDEITRLERIMIVYRDFLWWLYLCATVEEIAQILRTDEKSVMIDLKKMEIPLR